MSYLDVASGSVVANLSGEARAGFIRRTYAHVAGAIVALAIVESILLQAGLGAMLLQYLGAGTMNYLIYLGLFIGASIVADNWAHSDKSRAMQYVGLGLYVVVQAVILAPAMHLASLYAPSAIMDAAIATAALVTGLSYICFTTRKDFSFLGPIVAISLFIAIGLCIAGAIFGFNLGVVFAGAIVVIAAASVLYSTSNILLHYQEHQHVGAALGLFASVALMFRFMLQIFMSFGDD
ncbi:MAG: Bax inhibitor-1 family protein [Acidiferrobacterales bacterium]|nr:Bax inhibitor-1 family protein [Acidiferrobacterales bacterium]